MGCAALGEGLNCWEVDRSPCCHRPRNLCRQCRIFIRAQRSGGAPAHVLLAMADGGLLEGEVHVPPGQRVSSLLNDPQRRFLALRSPRWQGASPGGGRGATVQLVNLAYVVWLVPLAEPDDPQAPAPGAS
jgi:hypothetical protein